MGLLLGAVFGFRGSRGAVLFNRADCTSTDGLVRSCLAALAQMRNRSAGLHSFVSMALGPSHKGYRVDPLPV